MKEKLEQQSIRNFCIISHIDHGKSTLADRFLELTGTVPKQKMREQYLDQMDLERERGITIKMQPVRMIWKNYILNLIDTPGHVDFTYEVSRALACVEGAILLIDATQGIQAQTLGNLNLAKKQNLKIIPIINKIDLPQADIGKVTAEIESVLDIKKEEILTASAKEGKGIEEIIQAVIERIPPPKSNLGKPLSALVFDSTFDPYKGVICYVKIMDGQVKSGDQIKFLASKTVCDATEVGYFSPEFKSKKNLQAGEIGYITTGLKSVQKAKVGDTITSFSNPTSHPLSGYKPQKPYVFASIYTTSGEPKDLKDALEKLQLNDSALSFKPESSPALGMGFRCGFLGLLHLDITKERLQREYNLDLIITVPSVSYKVIKNNEKEILINNPSELPENTEIKEICEPYVLLEIVTPSKYLGPIMKLVQERRGEYKDTEYLDPETCFLTYNIPLNEIIIDFYDHLKSISSGYASLNYEFLDFRKAKLVKLDILITEDLTEPLSQIVPEEKAYQIGRALVKRLKDIIPRQLFKVALQAAVGSKIIAREDIPALRKDVTAKLYGGDVTRKRKLLEKQKKGKKKMGKLGKIDIPQEAFMAVLKR